MRRPGLLLLAALVCGCASSTVTTSAPPTADGTSAPAVSSYTPDQLLVLLTPAPPAVWQRASYELASDYQLRQLGAWTVGSIDDTPCVVYQAPTGRDVHQIVRHMAQDPRVVVAEPVHRFKVLAEPAPKQSSYNDPYVDLQKGVEELSLAAAQRVATGRGVKVGIIDTGMELDHPDLRGRIAGVGNYVDKGERSFTSDVHGTAVAGILAAGANNSVGIVGVAPGAMLYAFKACWQDPPASRQAVCDSYTLARAVDAAIGAGVRVLNLSLSGPPDPFLSKLIGAALAKRTVVIAAYDAAQPDGGFPASREGVIAVGAEPRPGEPPAAASRAGPAVVGPGVDVLSTAPAGSYDFFSGSSFAAAHAAGVTALLLEKRPELTPAEVRKLLVGTPSGPAPPRLDPCAALARLEGHPVCG